MDDLPLQLLPLGGLGEIGMNCMLIGHRDRWVMVDCGVQFPETLDIGAERKLSDLDVVARFADRIEAVVITHGHEDHIGALPWVLPLLDPAVPLHATPLTAELVRRRLLEHGEWTNGRVTRLLPGERFGLGPFEAEAIRVTHSLPDCAALVLRCEDGTILHTGDWKLDEQPTDDEPFDRAAFERLGDEGVTLMLGDSTNARVPGHTGSERAVATALRERIAAHDGRVVVAQFASNLHRIAGLVAAADATDRHLAFAGRSLSSYLGCAARVGRAPIDPGLLLRAEAIADRPPGSLLVVTTGSQGEPGSSLQRAAAGSHPHLDIGPGDLVLHSARVIPGNEDRTYRMFNALSRLGADLVYGRRAGIHASGHARQDELGTLLDLVRPAHLVPVHGEYTMLRAHAELATARGIDASVLVNGEVLAFGAGRTPGTVRDLGRVAEVPLETIYNDGAATGNREAMRLQERRRLAWNGVVVVDLEIERGTAGLRATNVQIETLALFVAGGELVEAMRLAVEAGIAACPTATPVRELAELIRATIRRLCRRRLEKRPEVIVVPHTGRLS